MADYPDIPALVARFEHYATYPRAGNMITPIEARDAAAALSRLTRALAERDAQLSAARGEALFWQEAEAQRTRERDEARAFIRKLLNHGSWYISAIELDTPDVDGEALRDEAEALAKRG